MANLQYRAKNRTTYSVINSSFTSLTWEKVIRIMDSSNVQTFAFFEDDSFPVDVPSTVPPDGHRLKIFDGSKTYRAIIADLYPHHAFLGWSEPKIFTIPAEKGYRSDWTEVGSVTISNLYRRQTWTDHPNRNFVWYGWAEINAFRQLNVRIRVRYTNHNDVAREITLDPDINAAWPGAWEMNFFEVGASSTFIDAKPGTSISVHVDVWGGLNDNAFVVAVA